MQLLGNPGLPEDTEAKEGFALITSRESDATRECSGGQGLDFLNAASRAVVAVVPTDEDARTATDAMVEGEI